MQGTQRAGILGGGEVTDCGYLTMLLQDVEETSLSERPCSLLTPDFQSVIWRRGAADCSTQERTRMEGARMHSVRGT